MESLKPGFLQAEILIYNFFNEKSNFFLLF